jgi:hypothetical protein
LEGLLLEEASVLVLLCDGLFPVEAPQGVILWTGSSDLKISVSGGGM